MHIEKKTLKRIFCVLVGCILVYWLLHEFDKVRSVLSFFRRIFAPFFAGAAIAFVLNVPMRFFERQYKGIRKDNIRRVLALASTLLSMLLVLGLVFLLLIPQVVDTIENLTPQLKSFFGNAETKFYTFLEDNPELLEWATNIGIVGLDWGQLAEKCLTFLGTSLSTILSGTFTAISAVTTFLVNTVIAIVFAIYCLFQKETLARQSRKLLYALLPEKVSDEIIRILRMSDSTFSNFLSGQCIDVLLLGGMFAIAMAIFDLPYIPLVCVLIAVTAFVPIVGAFFGCFIGAFLMLVNDPMQALFFIVIFLIIQQIEGNLIYPRVVGTSIGLSGMWVLVAVTIGGSLFGIVGMFVMVPVVSVLYTLTREFTQKRLNARNIDPEKLKPQPPIVKPKIFKFNKKRTNKDQKNIGTDSSGNIDTDK